MAAVVVLTASLACGAATALLDLSNLILWLPIPGTQPGRLVQVYTAHPQPFVGPWGYLPPADFEEYARSADSLEALVGERWASLRLEPTDETPKVAARTVSARLVSRGFFRQLGIRTAAGRVLEDDDHDSGSALFAVLGHSFWMRELGGDPSTIGGTVLLDRQPATVVGVVDARYRGATAGEQADLWIADEPATATFSHLVPEPLVHAVVALGRLAPGANVERARAELQNLAEELDRTLPMATGEREVTVIPARLTHGLDRQRFRPILQMLTVGVALLLLLTCANVASLLLARAIERRPEISMRLALGAPRRRLVRQLVVESAVLALLAAAAGLLIATASRQLFALWDLELFARDMRFDRRVLLGTASVAALVALLFGVLPAFAATSAAGRPGIATERAGTVSRRALKAFSTLAAVQVVLATVLLTCGAAIAFNLWSLQRVDLGFDDRGLVRASFFFEGAGYDGASGQELMRQLERRVAGLPGVSAVSRALFMPPVFLDVERTFQLPSRPEEDRSARINFVDDGYFEVLGVPLLHGRGFDDRELTGPPTAIVNEMLARQTWPDRPPEASVGQILLVPPRRQGEPAAEHQVVGVVGTIKQHDLRSDGEPILYLPLDQRPRPSVALVARVVGDPDAYVRALRVAASEIDERLQPDTVHTAAQLRWDALVVHRMQSQTTALLAAVGLLLSLVGVFAVMQLLVTRRRREIGVRMAVGADRGEVLRWVMTRSLRLVGAAAVLGIALAAASSRLLRGWVEDFTAIPAWLCIAAAAAVLATALLATLAPARRAARVQPAEVLRSE